MGFVKGIFCKINHLVIDAICHLFSNSLGKATVNALLRISVHKVLPLFFHHGKLLLTHGTAEQICCPHAKTGKVSDYLHNLLLIHDNAVGVFQDRLHFFTIVFYLIRIFLSENIVGNKIHGAGAVKRHTRNDVIEVGGLQAFHKIHHSAGFQLKNTCAISFGNHSVDLIILIIQLIHIKMNSVIFFYKTNGILYHREGS